MSLTYRSAPDKGYVAYADAAVGGTPVLAYEQNINLNQTVASQLTDGRGNVLDCHFWLPLAAEQYDLSKNFKDYVIVPNVPIIISDIPNTNGIAFLKRELLKFNIKQGRPAFKTFKGKPCYIEHQNTDPLAACGVILDVYVDVVENHGRGLIQVVELLAFDRLKNPDAAKAVASKESNCYSMGTFFDSFTMSDGSTPTPAKLKKPLYLNDRNELVFCLPTDLTGFETSIVNSPAFAHATNSQVIKLQ